MTLALRYAVRSDRGLVRGNNEDSVYAGPRLLAIADGMGGHAAGEVASKIAVGAIEHLDEDRPVGDLLAELRHAVEDANQRIADSMSADPELDGMGTTLTALRFTGRQVGLVHVGDSRAYLLRGEHLSQITHDDTYVQSLVDSGKLTAEEASHHPRKSVILRALMGSDVDPDVSIREVRSGDRYLLCTDGLSDVVTAPTLLEALSEGDPQECADRLVELALRGGGPDNVTCIVADIVEAGFGDDVPVIGGAFVDPTDPAPSPGESSPAERAAQMTRPDVPQHVEVPRRRRWLRRLLITAAVLVVLVGGTGGFYAWTQSQYFVGKSGDEVAIFRGVNTEFGPLKFYTLAKNTSLKMADLTQVARSEVESGITAHSESGAQRIVENLLQTQLLPLCPTATPTPSDRASDISPSTPKTTPKTVPRRAPSSARQQPPAQQPTARHVLAPRGSAGSVTPSPTPTLTPSGATTQPSPTPSSGEGCR
ncbi:MAG TPA: PP2C family serine/threonine-protein phosphatase [Jatrophihabitantaceae bacterium]|jgi:protein phosphatase